jgi:hypothetical protein|tara:strand:- start:49 stop:588 length:540 start_codon:yes stop_codon:yes gene_type:complete
MKSKELTVRKWRSSNALGKKRSWEYEIGEQGRETSNTNDGSESVAVDLFVSSSNPVFLRRDQPRAFVFRVRNLPYPREVYEISIDEEKQQIVLRTSNKKYFKRFDLPALKRLELPLDTSALTYDYDSSSKVLIMRYGKPKQVIEHEMEERQRHLSNVSTDNKKKLPGAADGGAPDCKTQ